VQIMRNLPQQLYSEKEGSNSTMTNGTTKHSHASPDPLPSPILDLLKSVHNGTITVHIENEPFLRLTITQSDTDRIKLEFWTKICRRGIGDRFEQAFPN
jgi:hypothetical protein